MKFFTGNKNKVKSAEGIRRIRQYIAKRGRLLISSSAFIILSYIFLNVYFQLANVEKVYAANGYYTISNGDWSSNANWSQISNTSASCNCNPGGNFNQVANVANKMTSSAFSPFQESGGGVINVSGTGSLAFTSGLEISGGSSLNIAAGDSVNVNGDFVISGGSNVNLNSGSYFHVQGNVTISGGSTVCGSGAGTATYSGSITGSGWNTACGEATLPVGLLYFNATASPNPSKGGNQVDLTWTTASEINNDYFTISRSQDGINFMELLRKPGAGTSTKQMSYSAVDNAPLPGISYYRLSQTDYNGNSVNYSVKAVAYGFVKNGRQVSIITIGPNPFKDNFNVGFSVAAPGNVEVQLINKSGQMLYKETISSEAGFNTYNFIDRQELPPGTYMINMICNGETVTQNLLKQ